MMKFIKIKDPDNKHDISNITYEIPVEDLTLGEVAEAFEDFLKACGCSSDLVVEITYRNSNEL